MPLKSGSSRKTISSNIEELHSGNTYARTAATFGADKANKQAVAIALSKARESKPKMSDHAKAVQKIMRKMNND